MCACLNVKWIGVMFVTLYYITPIDLCIIEKYKLSFDFWYRWTTSSTTTRDWRSPPGAASPSLRVSRPLLSSHLSSIPFFKGKNFASLYMMLASTLIYFFAPMMIVTLLYIRSGHSQVSCNVFISFAELVWHCGGTRWRDVTATAAIRRELVRLTGESGRLRGHQGEVLISPVQLYVWWYSFYFPRVVSTYVKNKML